MTSAPSDKSFADQSSETLVDDTSSVNTTTPLHHQAAPHHNHEAPVSGAPRRDSNFIASIFNRKKSTASPDAHPSHHAPHHSAPAYPERAVRTPPADNPNYSTPGNAKKSMIEGDGDMAVFGDFGVGDGGIGIGMEGPYPKGWDPKKPNNGMPPTPKQIWDKQVEEAARKAWGGA